MHVAKVTSETEKTVFAAVSDSERRTMGDMGRLTHGQAHITALLTRPDVTQSPIITCRRREGCETAGRGYGYQDPICTGNTLFYPMLTRSKLGEIYEEKIKMNTSQKKTNTALIRVP
ncbi:hypothetical protein E2C01_077558 [Portunus trituberculatus]|uniref:Uncharacterized protein n=1 Tax=Portunus trituberculatus TaxID=210409 RepID=A0A5B7IKJ1_PORTR|nr:hypothetical protein [Portunus trituberculatus]